MSCPQLVIPQNRLGIAARRLWSALPGSLPHCKSVGTFKKRLKTDLFKSALVSKCGTMWLQTRKLRIWYTTLSINVIWRCDIWIVNLNKLLVGCLTDTGCNLA